MGICLAEQGDIDLLSNSREDFFTWSEVKYRALLENMNNSYALYEVLKEQSGKPAGYVLLDVNPAFERQIGVLKEAVVGKDISETIIAARYMGIDWITLFNKTAKDGIARTFEKHSELLGRWFWIAVFCPREGYIGVLFSDITQQKDMEEKPQYYAYHDHNMEVSSQRLLEDRLMLAILQAKRNREQLAVAMFSVDNFQWIVDNYGQAAGNELLQEIARRTVRCLRQSDTIARVESDTFGIILPAVNSRTNAVMVANRVLEECRRPLLLRDVTIIVSGSINICFFPQDQVNFAEMVSPEDVKMYLSKQRRYAQVCLTM